MGYKTIINTMLRLSPSQGLDPTKLSNGKSYQFEKDEERVYPLHVPVPLITDQWEYVGLVHIEEVSVGHGKTRGVFEVVRVFDKQTRELFFELFGRLE